MLTCSIVSTAEAAPALNIVCGVGDEDVWRSATLLPIACVSFRNHGSFRRRTVPLAAHATDSMVCRCKRRRADVRRFQSLEHLNVRIRHSTPAAFGPAPWGTTRTGCRRERLLGEDPSQNGNQMETSPVRTTRGSM